MHLQSYYLMWQYCHWWCSSYTQLIQPFPSILQSSTTYRWLNSLLITTVFESLTDECFVGSVVIQTTLILDSWYSVSLLTDWHPILRLLSSSSQFQSVGSALPPSSIWFCSYSVQCGSSHPWFVYVAINLAVVSVSDHSASIPSGSSPSIGQSPSPNPLVSTCNDSSPAIHP